LVYIDSTVLIAYTLTKLIEKEKYVHIVALIDKVNKGEIAAVTSFYALHEVLIFALRNAPDLIKGRKLGKEALLEVLQTRIEIVPMLTREERILHARTFSSLKDPSDMPHAISALLWGCEIMV
jgi:predicted nucleic acid-binding protein